MLTRDARYPLYNTAAGETSANLSTSPIGTMWAFGTLDSNAPNLSYVTFASLRNGDLGQVISNQPMVMHILTNAIVTDDIYVAVKFTFWGEQGAGGWTYIRSTAPQAIAPTVSITSPVSGAAFAAPANVKISANAAVSGGNVTNVSFYAGANLLGIVTAAPFSLTASNLAAGSYALTAVAAAGGLSTTSSVVNITIVSPVATVLSSSTVTNGRFAFDYTANSGLSYVVQSSSNLTSWISVVTNVAASNHVNFSDAVVSNSGHYYRVGRLPNP